VDLCFPLRPCATEHLQRSDRPALKKIPCLPAYLAPRSRSRENAQQYNQADRPTRFSVQTSASQIASLSWEAYLQALSRCPWIGSSQQSHVFAGSDEVSRFRHLQDQTWSFRQDCSWDYSWECWWERPCDCCFYRGRRAKSCSRRLTRAMAETVWRR
jgi:hypothetical protein